MIALLPVSRYRVRYHVASGRPYSFFERFVLEAITEGQSSLNELTSTFAVHRRALIESVITLMQAGWVAIDRDTHALVPTAAGRRAITGTNQLPKNIVVAEQTDYVVGERVQGQVAKGSDITFASRAELRAHWNQAVVIPKGNIPHPLEPGILTPLLRLAAGEWIRSCGPIDIVRDGADFVVVDVDTNTERITGIPSKWVPLLREDLFERARQRERQLVLDGNYASDTSLAKLVRRDLGNLQSGDADDTEEWTLDPGLDRIVVGNEQHHALFEDWLDSARSYVAIVSGTLDVSAVEQVMAPLQAAIERGVHVDIMWGAQQDSRREDAHRRAFNLLKKLEWDSHHSTHRGRLTVGRTQTGSHAKILLGDVSDAFEVVVGSYDWLASGLEQSQLDVSLLFREPGPVVTMARLVADLANSDERLSTSFGLTRLRHAVADLGRQISEAAERRAAENAADGTTSLETRNPPPAPAADRLRARLVVGRQHHAILPVLAAEARERMVVACSRWGSDSEIGFRPLREALERGCRRVEIRYRVDVDKGDTHDQLAQTFRKLGGLIRETPNFHARIAVADEDTAAVTSFDWLCPDLNRPRPTTSDIGFVLRGKGIGSTLLDRVGLPALEPPVPLDAEYLKSFRIERLRSVTCVDWQLEGHAGPGWHVMVGDNGSGKTTILRAVALALMGASNLPALKADWNQWLRGADATTAGASISLERIPGRPSVASSHRVIALQWQRTGGDASLRASPPDAAGVLSVGYGPFRRFSGGDPEYEKHLAAVPESARHLSLFNERVALTETLSWLQELRFKSLEHDLESALLLDRLTKLVNEAGLLPSRVQLASITSAAVTFRDEHGYEYPIDDLSDGYRSVLSLTLDIVRQLALAVGPTRVFDPEKPAVVSTPAIVLIDEVDAHLHPAWQRTIGPWFCQHFPAVQFIVTTHSPLVCQAAETGSVFRLPSRDDEQDAGAMLEGTALARLIYGNVLEAYSSGAFGDGITRSEKSKQFVQRLAELNRKELDTALTADEETEQQTLRSMLPLAAHLTTDGGVER